MDGGWLSPKVWIPAGAILGLAMLAAGALVGWKLIADEKQDVTVVTCDPGPDCQPRVPVHWHADFAVFVNGEQVSFDDEDYFSTEDQVVNASAHLHEPRTSVVHVHRSLTVWREFFESLGFDLTDKSTIAGQQGQPSCLTMPDGEEFCEDGESTFKFVVNGVQVDGIADTEIADIDRVLISYGSETIEEVMGDQWPQVSDEACIPSGRCLERGDPVEEPCGIFDTTCTE
jgi:hypothetical protein